MQIKALTLAVAQLLRARQMPRVATPAAPSVTFRSLSPEEQRVEAERVAFNAKVQTRQVRRRLTRPWKQRATT